MDIKIALLGSTGSIGTQTVSLARQNKEIKITSLAAYSNVALLERQAREFHVKRARYLTSPPRNC